MNTYIYTGGSSLLTMKDNDIKNFDTNCCEACVKEA